MKRLSAILLIFALFASFLFIVSCSDENEVEQYKYKDGKITSEDGSKSFIPAPMGFQPYSIGEKCAVRDGAFDLFELIDPNGNTVSTDDWMTEEYAGNATTVYYREGISLPEYTDIDFEVCYVCEEDVRVVSIASITDKELIDTLISHISNGTSKLLLDDPVSTYSLKFYSSDYPALYYAIDYLIFSDGKYLFNRAENTYSNIGPLLDEYVIIEEDTAK